MLTKSARRLRSLLPMLVAIVGLGILQFENTRIKRAETALHSYINYLDRKEAVEARVNIDYALAISPQNAHYISNRALWYERTAEIPFNVERLESPQPTSAQDLALRAAIEDYRRVLTLNPNDDFAYHNLGWLYWMVQDRSSAIECLTKANTIDHSVPLYHVSLGLVLEFSGDDAKAAQEYSEAIFQSPRLLDSPFFSDLRRRAPANAEKILAQATSRAADELAKSPSPIVKARLGKLYLGERPQLALPLLQEASSELPNLYHSWFNLGAAYESQQDWRAMEDCYKKSAFLNSWEVQSLYGLARYYDSNGRIQDAIRNYRGAISGRFSLSSVHSTRVRRIYLSNFTLQDDLIPNGLLIYTSPEFDIVAVCRRLAQLYQNIGNEKLANYYRNLMDGAALRFAAP